MTTQAPATSQHLAAAQKLLDELDAVTQQPDTDSQTKATTAAARAILVLAEQVAAIRVLMVEDMMAERGIGQPAAQGNGQPAAQGNGQPAAQGNGQPAPQDVGQPAPQDVAQPAPQDVGQPAPPAKAAKKRGWW